MPTVQERMQSIIDKANATTGKTDADLTIATQSLVDGFGKGGTLNPTQYINNFVDFRNMFKNAVMPAESTLEIYLTDAVRPAIDGICYGAKGATKLVLISDRMDTLTAKDAFRGPENSFKIIDFSKFSAKLSDITSFLYYSDVEEIIGNIPLAESYISSIKAFQGMGNLRDIQFSKGSIKESVNFANSRNLSAVSVQSIIDGLAQVTETQTLTLPPDVKAELTEAQIARITSKNWNLA